MGWVKGDPDRTVCWVPHRGQYRAGTGTEKEKKGWIGGRPDGKELKAKGGRKLLRTRDGTWSRTS